MNVLDLLVQVAQNMRNMSEPARKEVGRALLAVLALSERLAHEERRTWSGAVREAVQA